MTATALARGRTLFRARNGLQDLLQEAALQIGRQTDGEYTGRARKTEQLNRSKIPSTPDKEAPDNAEAPPHAAPPPQAASFAGFMPAPTFAGPPAGYIFQMGPSGVGYYRGGCNGTTLRHSLPILKRRRRKGALPNAFFDDPQNDPANKGKEVVRTNKEQSLNEELDAFNKEVEEDLKAADAADEEEEEDEEEGRLREEVAIAGALEAKMDGLKRKRGRWPSGRRRWRQEGKGGGGGCGGRG